jgi:gliding motility-associated-like protein
MYNRGTTEKDFFGGFPVICPNGSGHSIRLGNSFGGGEAEGISYEFVIPANQNEYSLIYHYAVVFQDPLHLEYQQPRMQVEVVNLTDDSLLSCSSFTFVPYGNILPGFFESSLKGDDDSPVWCKDWSAVSVNLDGLAGKTIRLFFKTADCTFRRHFGYAYIDVNTECSSEFIGATFCPDDTAVNVTAPFGYQVYKWWDSNFTRVLGTNQTIRFFPPPPTGTTIAVEVIPYNGYGCVDTLYARLIDTLTITAFAGPDQSYCGDKPVPIGGNPKPGLVYRWNPTAGLSDPNIANPFASPNTTTKYVLSVRNSGGGCLSTDEVLISSSALDTSLNVIGRTVYCLGMAENAVLQAMPTDSIQWYRNGVPVGNNATQYVVGSSGNYYARLFNDNGCAVTTRMQSVLVDIARKGITYPTEYAVSELPYKLQARDFGSDYQWSPSSYLDDPGIVSPQFKSNREEAYTIRIETTTGCVTVDTLAVKIVPFAEIQVPTAFTPNNDGKNDVLRPVLMGIKELRYFRVFNRWGQLLYETKSASVGWDGRINGKQQQTEVVVWVAEGVGSDGKVYIRKGTSALIQ